MARNGFNTALSCSRLFVNGCNQSVHNGSRLQGRIMASRIADGELSRLNGNSVWSQMIVQRLVSTYNAKSMTYSAAAASPLPQVDEKSIADVASNVYVEPQRHNWSKKTEVWLDELIELLDAGKIRLIDVREPTEIEEMGSIPTSINIPLTDLKKSLLMSDDMFQNTYGIAKPRKDDNRMVFYGLTYIRSAAAVELAQRLGYKRVRQYVGGWYEWSIMCRTDC